MNSNSKEFLQMIRIMPEDIIIDQLENAIKNFKSSRTITNHNSMVEFTHYLLAKWEIQNNGLDKTIASLEMSKQIINLGKGN